MFLYASFHRNMFIAFLNSIEAQKQPAEKRLTTYEREMEIITL